ncbi:MAG: hypothetical protein H6Q48_1361 [Deltaproteobacteria bacterium]|nr:hypothetical protein [Deltaproteobacteria bacterium]
MAIGKGKKKIIRNGVLVSLMAFYFSCGKDVFPPDSPDEPGPERGAATTSLVLHDAEEKFSSCPVHRVLCTSPNVPFHLQQLGHQDCASCSPANGVV